MIPAAALVAMLLICTGMLALSWPQSAAAQGFILGVRVDITTGTNPYSIAIGDLNGDGNLDMVVANNFSNSVSVLHGYSLYMATVDELGMR